MHHTCVFVCRREHDSGWSLLQQFVPVSKPSTGNVGRSVALHFHWSRRTTHTNTQPTCISASRIWRRHRHHYHRYCHSHCHCISAARGFGDAFPVHATDSADSDRNCKRYRSTSSHHRLNQYQCRRCSPCTGCQSKRCTRASTRSGMSYTPPPRQPALTDRSLTVLFRWLLVVGCLIESCGAASIR